MPVDIYLAFKIKTHIAWIKVDALFSFGPFGGRVGYKLLQSSL